MIVPIPQLILLVLSEVDPFKLYLPLFARYWLNECVLMIILFIALLICREHGMDGAKILNLGLLNCCKSELVFNVWVHSSLGEVVDDPDIPIHEARHQWGVIELASPT